MMIDDLDADESIFILDESWIDVSNYSNFNALYQTNPCLQLLLNKLYYYVCSNLDDDSGEINIDCGTMKQFLIDNDIVILVHYTDYCYIDIVSGAQYDLCSSSDVLSVFDTHNVYVMGYWELSNNLYSLLKSMQNSHEYNLYIFVYPIDPIIFDPDGLDIFICGIGDLGDYEYDEVAAIFLNDFINLIRSIVASSSEGN